MSYKMKLYLWGLLLLVPFLVPGKSAHAATCSSANYYSSLFHPGCLDYTDLNNAFAVPPVIGSTTPNAANFTTLTLTALLSPGPLTLGNGIIIPPAASAPSTLTNGQLYSTSAGGLFYVFNGVSQNLNGGGGGGGGTSLTVKDSFGTPNTVTSVANLTFGACFQVSPASGNTNATVNSSCPPVNVTSAGYTGQPVDMGHTVNLETCGTLTIPAISGTYFPSGATAIYINACGAPIPISSTPGIKVYGSAIIPAGGGLACTSDGTYIWCPSIGVPPVISGNVLALVTIITGNTYTIQNSDCATQLNFTATSGGNVVVTAPSTLPVGCNVYVMEYGTQTVKLNGSVGTPATLHSRPGYTGTAGQWSIVGLNIPAAGVAVLSGDGS